MKKLLIVAAAAASLSGVAFGQTNQVLSRNAVGYEAITCPSGKLMMVRNDFINLSGASYTVTNLIGDQLPSGSTVFLWSRSAATYVSEAKGRSGWLPGTNVIPRGSGFFIQVPGGGSNQYTVYFMGEVPDTITAPTTTLGSASGVQMMGYPYPADIFWTNTVLSKSGQSGDNLYLWDTTNQTYVSYARTRSGWIGEGSNLVIRPGQAFWFLGTNTPNWTEVKPYTWP